jgi:hypothetical protein
MIIEKGIQWKEGKMSHMTRPMNSQS